MAKSEFTDAALAVTQAELGGQIVSQTLDALNSPTYSTSKNNGAGSSQDMSDSYNFNKSVLESCYLGKGTAVDSKG